MLPTASLKFDVETTDFDKLRELINDDAVELDQESLFLKLAFMDSFSDHFVENSNKSFEKVKDKLSSTLGKSIVGNLVNEPELTTPCQHEIKELLSKPTMNLLHNTESLNKIELDEIVKPVLSRAANDDHQMKYVEFLQNHKEDFAKAERKIRKDIAKDQYELVIVAQSVITNKFLDEYQRIKDSLDPFDVKEKFLYRGALLNKHFMAIEKGFNDNVKGSKGALFGLGVYATQNLFYACYYGNGNGCEKVKIYDRAPVFLCKTVYNRNKIQEIKISDYKNDDVKNHFLSQPISDDIKNNYGIHHALVGRTSSWRAVDWRSPEAIITGEEFVFANRNQIVPICSFTVMRSDHYLLWKDEKIDNEYNQSYFRNVNRKIQVNMYVKKTVEEALSFIRLKIKNRVKLITNGSQDFTGREFIIEARNIVGSNFICLVFSRHRYHCDWILQTENVLYTSKIDMFEKFSLLKMDEKSLLGFIDELEKAEDLKFNINEDQMLYFPHADVPPY